MLIKMNLRKAIVLLGILFFWSGQAVPQNRVVVIPLGSDVSAKQFNDLLNQVNRTQVLSGFVDSFHQTLLFPQKMFHVYQP